MSWRSGVKLLIRAGCPIAGVVVIGHAALISIGGEIKPAEFALGIGLVVLTFVADLVPDDPPGPDDRPGPTKARR